MMYYIGIDPGQKGAIAVLNSANRKTTIIDMPLFPNKEICSSKLNDFFEKEIFDYYNPDCFCILEKAQVMHKQGRKNSAFSMFSYGKGYGKVQGVLECLAIPYREIHPRSWKSSFHLINKNKNASITFAQKLYPEADIGKKDGRAEALLLAEYAKMLSSNKIFKI